MSHDETQLPGAVNPYAPTIETASLDTALSPEEIIRKQYIRHETSIESIGGLLILFGVCLCLITFAAESVGTRGNASLGDRAIVISWTLIGAAQIISAIGIYRFKRWGRWSAVLISVGWIASVIGSILSLYFLYLLLSPKGKYVFSSEYQAIRRATPQVKYRMPLSSVVTVVGVVVFSIVIISIFLG